MGSMVVGFSSAYTSPALVSMRDPNITSFTVSEQEVSTVENFPIASFFPTLLTNFCVSSLTKMI
jgi:hypothetical protein